MVTTYEMSPRDEERFRSKYVEGSTDECWTWLAAHISDGYGGFKIRGRMFGAHRIAWYLHHRKPIPDGHVVMHSCDFPGCVNPHHLTTGTHADNLHDRDRKGRGVVGDRSIAALYPGIRHGERNGNAKLTWEKVRAIRAEAPNSHWRIMCAKYGIKKSMYHYIISGRYWKES